MKTAEQLQQVAKDLSAETGLTIKPGYVGNCDMNGRNDSRCWFVWISNARLDSNNNMVNVGPAVSTEHLDELLEALTLENVKAALAKPGSHACSVMASIDRTVLTTHEESVALIAGLV